MTEIYVICRVAMSDELLGFIWIQGKFRSIAEMLESLYLYSKNFVLHL